MDSLYVKLAVAATIVVAAITGITLLMQPDTPGTATVETAQTETFETVRAETFSGPLTHVFDDGSDVTLANGASIQTFGQAATPVERFLHLAGWTSASL